MLLYPVSALLTPLPVIPFTTEKIVGCTNKGANGDNTASRNPPSCFFISSFTVSVTTSINTPESSSDFMIAIISSISSFEMNKVNPFPALAAPFPFIFLSNLFIADEAAFEAMLLIQAI